MRGFAWSIWRYFAGAPFATSITRSLTVATAVILRIDEHWLDFDIRIAVPALLIFLQDQPLSKDVSMLYRNDHPSVVLRIGVGRLVDMFMLALVPTMISDSRDRAADQTGSDRTPDGA